MMRMGIMVADGVRPMRWKGLYPDNMQKLVTKQWPTRINVEREQGACEDLMSCGIVIIASSTEK